MKPHRAKVDYPAVRVKAGNRPAGEAVWLARYQRFNYTPRA